MDSADWYAIAVRSGREFEAVEELSGVCREVRCPTRRKITGRDKKTRKPIWCDVPLWPSYIFSRVGSDSAWQALYSAKHVIGPLCSGGEPRALRGASLLAYEATCRACDMGEFDDANADERVRIGERLRIIVGPLADLEVAVLRKFTHSLECEALIEILGHRPKVRISYDDVIAIDT